MRCDFAVPEGATHLQCNWNSSLYLTSDMIILMDSLTGYSHSCSAIALVRDYQDEIEQHCPVLDSSVVFLQIHANCRIRRVYFSDRLYSEEELPAEFKLYLPLQTRKWCHSMTEITINSRTVCLRWSTRWWQSCRRIGWQIRGTNRSEKWLRGNFLVVMGCILVLVLSTFSSWTELWGADMSACSVLCMLTHRSSFGHNEGLYGSKFYALLVLCLYLHSLARPVPCCVVCPSVYVIGWKSH
jgi:Protein of unknown function (DUF667)